MMGGLKDLRADMHQEEGGRPGEWLEVIGSICLHLGTPEAEHPMRLRGSKELSSVQLEPGRGRGEPKAKQARGQGMATRCDRQQMTPPANP